jgi:hypothetical protein
MGLEIGIGLGMTMRGGVSSFTPLSLSPVLWLDATQTLYTTAAGSTPAVDDGDPVGRWPDQSGNGNHVLQATSGKRPTIINAVQNGKRVVRFDGVDDCLARTPLGVTVAQPFTLFVVAAVTGAGAVQFICDNDSVSEVAFYRQTGNSLRFYAGVDLVFIGAVFPMPATLLTAVANGAISAIFRNGSQDAAGYAGSNALTGLVLGAAYTRTSLFLDGDILEFLLYGNGLSTPNRQAVETYLKAKWGIP